MPPTKNLWLLDNINKEGRCIWKLWLVYIILYKRQPVCKSVSFQLWTVMATQVCLKFNVRVLLLCWILGFNICFNFQKTTLICVKTELYQHLYNSVPLIISFGCKDNCLLLLVLRWPMSPVTSTQGKLTQKHKGSRSGK